VQVASKALPLLMLHGLRDTSHAPEWMIRAPARYEIIPAPATRIRRSGVIHWMLNYTCNRKAWTSNHPLWHGYQAVPSYR
jgi:hypothetical protein